jgi:hypothetical protein
METMPMYKFLWVNGWTAGNSMTVPQYEAACKVAQRFNLDSPITVHSGSDECIMIEAGGMWLGIERDGYTHS